MQISQERLDEFKKIYKERFGRELTQGEAFEKASGLIRLIKLVYRPYTTAEIEYMKRRRFETFAELLDHFAGQDENE